jgi:NAD(P)-dependent dehydrogenase (short-subunit alcohol dehydrogenase family)|tara:strand:- start:360 stop:1118 length:759 start_codon:yes stop_codon:yes gene_type:complete
MQKVLITAGASGIGYALAEAFYAEGYKVWVIDISEEDLTKCPKNWEQTKLDVSDENAMMDLFNEIKNKWGGLDVVCANAGTAGPTELVEDQGVSAFKNCLDVNLIGAFLSVKGCLPIMKKQGRGAIIFTSSTAGLYGFPYRSPYSASKWAIHGLMKTVAMEAGSFGIRANAIAPGCVEGDRINGVIEREAIQKNTKADIVRQAYKAGTSLNTFIEARDIAAMAVFLASEAARLVSGQIIAVDGHTENPDPKM